MIFASVFIYVGVTQLVKLLLQQLRQQLNSRL
jgi:hypothetical protein